MVDGEIIKSMTRRPACLEQLQHRRWRSRGFLSSQGETQARAVKRLKRARRPRLRGQVQVLIGEMEPGTTASGQERRRRCSSSPIPEAPPVTRADKPGFSSIPTEPQGGVVGDGGGEARLGRNVK